MFQRKKQRQSQAVSVDAQAESSNRVGQGDADGGDTQAVIEMMAARSHAKHPHSKDDDDIQAVQQQPEEQEEASDDDDDDDLFKFSPPIHTAGNHESGLLPPVDTVLQPPRTATARLKTAVSSVKRGMTGNSLLSSVVQQQQQEPGQSGDSSHRPVTSEARRIIKAYRKQYKQEESSETAVGGGKSNLQAFSALDAPSGMQQRRQPYVYPGSPVYNLHPHSRSSESPTTSPTRDGTHTPVIELADRLRQASTMTMSYPPEYGHHPDDLRSVSSYSNLRGANGMDGLASDSTLNRRASDKDLLDRAGASSAVLRGKTGHTDEFDEVDMREIGDGQYRLPSARSDRIQTASYVDGQAMDSSYLQEHMAEGDKLSFSAFELEDEEDSPYPEVRASVSNIDDPEMPCLTFRVWVLGLLLTAIGGGVNLFFSVRYPAPLITPITVQVVSYPMGKFLAYILPTKIWRPSTWARRFLLLPEEFSMNPGPFNIKEHTVIVIMANISISPPYALNFTTALDKFYNIPKGVGFDFLTVVTTNVIGFSFAGICRRYLVWPASLVWPQNLVTCTLFNTFHAEDDDGSDGSLTRYRFFTIVLGGAFCWYFLPGFLFAALSSFSFICWAAPRNKVVNQLFGVSSGLGMSVITFDWSQIAYIGSPLIIPWWAEVNMFVGFVVLYWILTPILYYTNTWNFAYMPISASGNFDRYGQYYNVSAVITPDTTLDEAGYQAYSPLFMTTTFATVYGLSFTLASAAIVHTLLHNGKEIFARFTSGGKKEEEDVHAKLMRNYPEVPDWWYWSTFVIFASLAIVAIEVYETGLPVWGLILALLVPAIYILPGGYIYALTAQLITINIISEMIPGYLLDGKPIPNMLFKTFSVQCLQSGLYFVQDLKLGHYMKIPPRVTFIVQLIATCVAAASQVGVKKTLEALVPDLCTRDQHALLSCPTSAVTYEASIIWGVIGPKRSFGAESLYQPLLYFLLLGALLPIPLYLAGKKWPKTWLRFVNVPVLLNGASYIPPATGINYSSWFIVGFIFQYWMRRHRFRWWSKFCFITSAALEGGTVISAVFIFFTLQLPRAGELTPKWWGNEVFKRTADWLGVPYMLPPEEGFGPRTWS